MKIIKVKQDPETKNGYIDLVDLKDFVNILQVKSYTLDTKNKKLILKLYDKSGILVSNTAKTLTHIQAAKELRITVDQVKKLIFKKKLTLINKKGRVLILESTVSKLANLP